MNKKILNHFIKKKENGGKLAKFITKNKIIKLKFLLNFK